MTSLFRLFSFLGLRLHLRVVVVRIIPYLHLCSLLYHEHNTDSGEKHFIPIHLNTELDVSYMSTSGRCNFLKTIYHKHYMSETWTEQNDMNL